MYRTPNGYEQWALVSDFANHLETFETYALRFDIEESFLDDKSGGFQLEASKIDDADALFRLLLILATATLYLVSTGTAIVAHGPSLHGRYALARSLFQNWLALGHLCFSDWL
ncbi:MAG: hypothetical protein R2867_32940 [Caldilineaceae bacterium]